MGKQFAFGSGSCFGVNTTANSTPERFGALQNISLDISFTLKELYGQNNFPLTVARAAGKITFKAASASFQARQFNDLVLGGTLSAGQTATALDEAGTVPTPAGPYTITSANAANYIADMGVVDYATGLSMVKVASTPATGQYSVNVSTGVYTFAAADAGKVVRLNYTYSVSGSGQKIAIAQSLMGVAPTFSLLLSSTYNGQQLNLYLNACVASKLAMATKTEDFTIPDFEGQAFADASGNIGYMSFANSAD